MPTKRKPGPFSTEIRHVSECAFQRAIILGKYSIVNGKRINWIDIELPVDKAESARGKCIDLIGKDSDGNYVICELKFRRKYRDNGGPIEATKQLKEYFELINSNIDYLKGLQHDNATESINWDDVAKGKTRLFVVANKDYFESWCVRKHTDLPDDDGVEYYAVNVNQNEFSDQKGTLLKYMPIMPDEGFEWVAV